MKIEIIKCSLIFFGCLLFHTAVGQEESKVDVEELINLNTLTGSRNQLDISQIGTSNIAQVIQGANDKVFINQEGSNQQAIVDIFGETDVQLFQYGNRNSTNVQIDAGIRNYINVTQNGFGHNVRLAFTRANNLDLTIKQEGIARRIEIDLASPRQAPVPLPTRITQRGAAPPIIIKSGQTNLGDLGLVLKSGGN